MRVLVYEHLTACGDPMLPASLRAEGAAMLAAVRSDFAACAGMEVVADLDDRFEAALVIAPETDGVLTGLVEQIERRGNVVLLSPASSFCAWASDKSQVAATMRAAGVPMPRGVLLLPGDGIPHHFPLPAVLKPNDGCGSQGVQFVANAHRDGLRSGWNATEGVRYRMEEFVAGMSVSVALLCGAGGAFPLPACAQRLAADDSFAYLGGSCPLEIDLAERAERLARRVTVAMPKGTGYIGLDLVLGSAADGSQDYLIEVNPRLTTSYVGLRAVCETNLAQAVLDVVAGRTPRFALNNRGVDFDSDGTVRYV